MWRLYDRTHDVCGHLETISWLQMEEAVNHRRCLQLFSLQRKPLSNDTYKMAYAKRKARQESRERGIEWNVPQRIRRWTHCPKTTSKKIREIVNETYTTKWLKERIIQYCGTFTVIAKRNDCKDVMHFND